MSSAASQLRSIWNRDNRRAKNTIRQYELTQRDVSCLRSASADDGCVALSAACVSISEAIGALDRCCYSWACVKFYYATYYCVRAWLSYSDEVHIYEDRKPWYLLLREGETMRKGAGNSHEYAFGRFRQRFDANPILSQDVEAEVAFDWMRHRREDIQYLREGFVDPACHKLFLAWEKCGGRPLLEFYLEVDSNAAEYATLFDSQQAMVAIPLRLCSDLLSTVRQQREYALEPAQLRHCFRVCTIGGHPVARWHALLKGSQ